MPAWGRNWLKIAGDGSQYRDLPIHIMQRSMQHFPISLEHLNSHYEIPPLPLDIRLEPRIPFSLPP